MNQAKKVSLVSLDSGEKEATYQTQYLMLRSEEIKVFGIRLR